MTKPRSDAHRPGAIIPAEYEYLFSYNGATSHDGWPVPSFGVNCELDRRTEKDGKFTNGKHDEDGLCCILGMLAAGKTLIGNACQCTVCGTHFVYGDVWQHTPSGEYIHIGHTCADKYRLLIDRSAWELECGRRKEAAAVVAQKAAKQEEREAFLQEHPGLEEALQTKHHITADIRDFFQRRASLSEKQVALVLKIAEDVKRPRPEEKLVAAPCSDERIEFTGRIVSIKTHEGAYGESIRMTVKIETPEGIWLAWGTLPAALYEAERGDLVEIKARLKPGRDAHFALMNRPHGIILERANPKAAS